MAQRIGADVGGTFTDLVVFDQESGELRVSKVPSIPADPAEAVVEGVRRLGADDVVFFSHGTTIALNTLIQRSGARVGLLITRGFRDVLRLRRLRLVGAPGFFVSQPPPLVPPRDVREISERLLASGTELRPLDRDEVLAAAEGLVGSGCETLAVSFLHSYRNPEHERHAGAWISERFPALHVTLSSDVWPQHREYERTELAVVDAHIAPVMAQYFSHLVESLRALGVTSSLFSTKSSGGIVSAARAAERPVETLVSGPASGVVAAAALGRLAQEDELVAFDMGGTSADIGIVQAGEVQTTTESFVGDVPVIMPSVDVSSVGAGGGSIARLDEAGVLKVGPQSAGADPGPACYGRGAEEPTVTDSYVTLGIVAPDRFLGGEFPLDARAARAACARLGKGLGLDPNDTAEAILQVATSNMYARLLPLMAQRGANASDFALLAYGGAGPTHAFYLAREAGFGRVIVPPTPGAFSGLGCLLGDLRADFVRTIYARLDPSGEASLVAAFEELGTEAIGWAREERVPDARLSYAADMRYAGQSYEIPVELPPPGDGFRRRVEDAFSEAYERVYGHSDRGAPVELVNARARVIGEPQKPRTRPPPATGRAPEPFESRHIRWDGGTHVAAIYERARLPQDARIEGCAIVVQYDTTTFIPPGYRAEVDEFGNLVGGPV
jgi:N-methylhydantoinase A